MLFSSFEFLFRFLPVFLVIYYLTPKKFRNVTLLGGSIVFYTIGEAGYITILLACVLVNYTLTRLMYRKNTDGRGIRQKRLLLLALGYDLGVLFFFKYSGLASGLPLGISFYTFQIMAYVIDVYRGRIPAEQSLLRLGTYLTMFPQLISGPITNYADVRVALGRERTIKGTSAGRGNEALDYRTCSKSRDCGPDRHTLEQHPDDRVRQHLNKACMDGSVRLLTAAVF